MALKIVKYKHYGQKMSGGENPSEFYNLFYWSFFELSNRKTVSLLLIETFKNSKQMVDDISCHYTNCYSFGDDFYVWLDKTFSDEERGLEDPTEDVVDLVEKFFMKNIKKTKNVESEIVYV